MKLSEIQKKLKVPKSQKNSFGNYNYRSCEDIIESVKLLLDEETKLYIKDDIVQIGDRFYVKATVFFKSDEDEIEVTAFAREPLSKKGQDEAQITGSASSYARKYALNGLFLIDDTKDADTMDNTYKEPTTEAPKAKLLKRLESLAGKKLPNTVIAFDWIAKKIEEKTGIKTDGQIGNMEQQTAKNIIEMWA